MNKEVWVLTIVEDHEITVSAYPDRPAIRRATDAWIVENWSAYMNVEMPADPIQREYIFVTEGPEAVRLQENMLFVPNSPTLLPFGFRVPIHQAVGMEVFAPTLSGYLQELAWEDLEVKSRARGLGDEYDQLAALTGPYCGVVITTKLAWDKSDFIVTIDKEDQP